MKDYVAKVNNSGMLNLFNARTGGFEKNLNTTNNLYDSAQVSGGTVHARRKDGRIDTYDTETGRFLRSI